MSEEEKQDRPKSVLEETKEAIDTLRREREEMAKIRDEINQLRSDQLLSGTAGIRNEPEKPKEESPREYMRKVMSGGLNERAKEE